MRARSAIAATLLLLGAGASGATPARPLRVMSLNQCTDQLVLMLLPPQRIASVSWLARDPGGSLMAAAARAVPANRGQAEEVLAERPDLVIAGTYTTPALRAILRRLRYPLLEVPNAESFAAIHAVTRQVAAAVGEQARGEALLAEMDRKLSLLARSPPPHVRVAAWERNGFAAGPATLYGEILRAAGAEDVGEGDLRYRRPGIETLLAARPALLVQGAHAARAASLGDDLARHRLVRRLWGGGRTVTIPQAAYACGTPLAADAAVALAGRLRRAARAAG